VRAPAGDRGGSCYYEAMSWADINIKKEGSLVATTYYAGGLAIPTYRLVTNDLAIWCHQCEWEGLTALTVDYSPKTVITDESYLVTFDCPQCSYSYKSEPRYMGENI
jgi:hypothetical protein